MVRRETNELGGHRRSEALWRGVAVAALLVGIGFALAPKRFVRLFSLPADGMTGTAALGWRLFAIRNVVIGGAVLAGSVPARRVVLLTRLLDQLVFLHALVTKSVPRRSAVLAMATSASIIGMSAIASRQGRPEQEDEQLPRWPRAIAERRLAV
ncbi:MAG: hypothetical protein M3509_05220 [Chloroflexota bacterium]|nr:hypothetical protein [Chloroflexota bacterium]